ncbi:zinc finger protein 646 [Festucalex cinctus]
MATLVEHMGGHLEQEEEERKFKCGECGRGYRHAGSLANHKKAHDVGLFECHVCGKENSNALALKSHMRSHTARKKYTCSQCGKAFRLATQLATHERVHRPSQTKNQEAEYEDPQEIANNHWSNQSTLGIQMESDKLEVYHPQCDTSDDATGRPFKCDLCDKTYIHLRSLNNHKMTHQLGMFECTVCFKLFNNMAALYSHQRSHKVRSGGSSLASGFSGSTQEQFPPKSPDSPVNFCHLCQVLFPSDEEFQEHIQMHNSSSASFGLQDNTAASHSMTCNNVNSPKSNFYSAHVNQVPSLPSVDNHQSFPQPHGTISTNGHMYSNCSNNQTPSSNCSPGEPPLMDSNILNLNASKMVDSSVTDSDERPFRCQICSKSYRHAGSLINHKRSHQLGVYQCSICWKKYPHLAALKSHLRSHKGHKTSFNPNADGDWLTSERFSPVNQQGLFSSQQVAEQDNGAHLALDLDQENGAMYHSAPDTSASWLTHSEHSMQRHMCADCGDTFADIAGIMAHACPLLRQQRPSGDLNAGGNFAGDVAQLHGLNGASQQSFFERSFQKNMSSDQLNGNAGDDDGDLYQCSICGNSYSSMRALRSHLRGHTQSQSAAASSGPSSMSSQEEAKDDEPGEMMICSTCGESFASRQDLIAHQLVHVKHQDEEAAGKSEGPGRKEETQSLICGRCGIFCTSCHHLESHNCVAEKKEGEEEAISEEAEQKTKNSHHEDHSNVRERFEDRQHRCDQCGRSYRHSGSLLNHKKSHKTGVFKCSVCQKRFYNLLALKNHHRSHFDVKRHTCHECGKAFKIQKQLLIHLRRHKENRAKIQELNNQVQALMQMNKSEGEDAGEAPGRETVVKSEHSGDRRPFACEQCGRTYRHAGSLVNHKKSHKTGQYYCSLCSKACSNQLAMKNHLRTHVANRKHSCQKCGKGFRGKRQLSAHVCADSRKGGRRGLRSRASKCKRCKQTFPSGEQLAAHACAAGSAASDKEERVFSCDVCHRSYRHAGSLLNHKNTHKTGHFSCAVCAKTFSNPMALRNHARIHTQKKKFVCLTCGKAFRLASILHNHHKVHSRAGGRFSCSACGKSFQGRSGLKRHRCRRGQGEVAVQSGGSQDKCFTCDLCGRSYRHAGSLLNHKKTHSENLHHCGLCLQTFPDPLTLQIHSQMRRQCCPECGKTFCLVAHLQSHMEVHTKDRLKGLSGLDEPETNDLSWTKPLSHLPESDPAEKSHVCEHCGRAYRHAGSLLNHKNSHKTGSFSCGTCHKEFSNLMALKNHRRIHTEPKRYQCLECGKAFRVSTQLICHRRIHSKEKPFACALCAKSFSSKSNLRHHERLHQNRHAYDDASAFSLDANNFMGLDMGSFL